jgi:nucleoside-diphosphate-sugar epimerase
MSKKFLLLGCSGEVGSRLTISLLKSGSTVFGVRGDKPCKIEHVNHSCIKVNLLDPNVDLAIEKFKPEVLIHTAWITAPNTFWESTLNFDWVRASKSIIKRFKENGGKYLVVTSTCAEYSWEKLSPLSENALENPKSIYGKAKLELLNWVRSSDIPFLWTRTFFQFGLLEPTGRLVPSLIDSLLLGKNYAIRNENDIRDFVYVKDVVSVIEKLVSQQQLGIMNIGTGIGLDIRSISTKIAKTIGREDLLQFQGNDRMKSSVVSNTDQLISVLKKFQWTDLDSALAETIKVRAKTISKSGWL